MRRVYDEFFYIPKQGKIRDKVMLARTATAVSIILICLASLCFIAYAYFSNDTTAYVGTVQAAEFDLTVSVTDKDNTPIPIGADGSYSLETGEYTVSLKKAGTANTGFCVINVTSGESTAVYYTAQIGRSGNTEVSERSFKLITEGDVAVTFLPHWGTSSRYPDYYNEDGKCIDDAVGLKLTGQSTSYTIGRPDNESTVAPPPTTATVSSEITSSASSMVESTTTSSDAAKPIETVTSATISSGFESEKAPADVAVSSEAATSSVEATTSDTVSVSEKASTESTTSSELGESTEE